ncbi:MAG: 1-deoxy-D-xylulose-5-phosphate reductoisomerase, partial [Desulfovibrio sp.]|nr:1-deoxy-D-xylulose-5-phosphate reductoisomerase [Desulfovibrio sp.]
MDADALERQESRFPWPGRGGPNIDYISAPPSAAYCSRRPRRLALLGSTGSVGRVAFDIAISDPDFFRIEALAGGKNTNLLAEQGARCKARFLATRDAATAIDLRSRLKEGYNPEILYGKDGYKKLASLASVDCVLSAQSGAIGLHGTLAAARAGKVIALANKESLAIGGNLIRETCRRSGASVLPVDSEHFALFQCAVGRGQTPAKFILTASGGPFRGLKREETRKKTVGEALRHPKWKMGAKITIDSATLM